MKFQSAVTFVPLLTVLSMMCALSLGLAFGHEKRSTSVCKGKSYEECLKLKENCHWHMTRLIFGQWCEGVQSDECAGKFPEEACEASGKCTWDWHKAMQMMEACVPKGYLKTVNVEKYEKLEPFKCAGKSEEECWASGKCYYDLQQLQFMMEPCLPKTPK